MVLIAMLGIVAACTPDTNATTAQTPVRPIAWAEVQPSDAAVTRRFFGILQPVQSAPLSFEIGGQVDRVDVDIGQHVARGDALATLDQETTLLELDQRISEATEADALLAEARNALDRNRRLLEGGWVSDAAFDDAQLAVESAQSRAQVAQARLARARTTLRDTRLLAPYGGTISLRAVEPSQHVSAGQTVLEIHGDGGGFEVVVSVPETLVSELHPGSEHQVDIAAIDAAGLTGTVREIGTQSEAANAYRVTLSLEDADASLRSGMTATVRLQLIGPSAEEATAVSPETLIPASGFIAGNGDGFFAYVYDPDTRRLARRDVVIRDVTGDMAIVTGGLAPGEIIATAGLSFLADDLEVRLLGEGIARYNP